MDLTYLTEAYIPDKILFRDEQINQIQHEIDVYKEWGYCKGQCLLISGRSGSGKTATLRYLTKTQNGFIKYASGIDFNKRSMSILKSLSELNYNTKHEILSEFIKNLKKDPKLLIIDEIDKIKDLKDFINTLNYIYRETQVPIIVSTNNLNFVKLLPEDARLTFFFKPISFPLYNVGELYSILNHRLDRAEVTIPEDKKVLMSAISGKEGSARLLLDIAYYCIKQNNFNDEEIKRRVRQYEDDELKIFILKNLNITDKKVMREILYFKERKIDITSNILKNRLTISRSSISRILDHLENQLGIIDTKHKNFGRKGGMIREIFMDDDTFNILKNMDEKEE